MKENMVRSHRRIVALVALVATTSLAVPAFAASDAGKLGDLHSVLGELRKGGLVVYFRHGLTDQTGASDESADLALCETQRNLSAEGREWAMRMGNAFKALHVPVGTVTSSPFCRCKDTANLAFGRFTVSNDLYFAVGSDRGETRRYAEALRRMLSAAPAIATNAVIVSHTANLREAAGIWPKPEGVAYIFRPSAGGKFEAIAMVAPEEWANVAGLKQSGKAK